MFATGALYKRSDLHHLYGGQRQGGICTPAGHNLILLFTGPSGQHSLSKLRSPKSRACSGALEVTRRKNGRLLGHFGQAW
jgi:hypothetical protein